MITKDIFVFDTETTGLFKDSMTLARIYHGEYDSTKEPYMLSLSYSIMRTKFNNYNDLESITDIEINEEDIILDWNVEVPANITEINKLTKEICKESGIKPIQAIHDIMLAIKKSDVLVCHNANYDIRILANAIQQLKQTIGIENKSVNDLCNMWLSELYSKEVVCTAYMSMMLLSNSAGKNYGSNKTTFKRKSLRVLHKDLIGYEFENAHNATADTLALFRVFKVLLKTYNHILKLYENSETAISKFTIEELREYKKNLVLDKYSLPVVNSWERNNFAMIMLNSQRNTLKSIARAHILQGTLFGSTILS